MKQKLHQYFLKNIIRISILNLVEIDGIFYCYPIYQLKNLCIYYIGGKVGSHFGGTNVDSNTFEEKKNLI